LTSQQGWPVPPHAAHMAMRQRVAGAVQVSPPAPPLGQQSWDRAPQGVPIFWQDPFMHIPPVEPALHA
jgi:hypothetical protein